MNTVITATAPNSSPMMSSREIAELTGSTHDNVLKTIRALVKKGVVSGNETPYIHPQNGQTYKEFQLDYRNTMVVTSGYSVELRAKIIDRWLELEAKPAIAPETPEMLAFRAITALQGKLEVIEEQAKLQAAMLEVAQPKAKALDRISIASGEYGLTETAKIIQLKPGKFFDWLDANRCRYTKGKVKLAYQDKIDAGYFRNRATFYTDANGEQQAGNTIRVTPKGLAWLARVVPGAKLDPAFEGAALSPFAKASA